MGADFMDVAINSGQRGGSPIPITGMDAAVYITAGEIVKCTVFEQSEHGAGLLSDAYLPDLQPGIEITLSMRTGIHTNTRRALVSWVEDNVTPMRLGVEFIDHIGLTPENHRLDVEKIRVDPVCALRIPAAVALRRRILPFLQTDKVLHVACTEIKNAGMANSIERMLKATVCLWHVDAGKLDKVLKNIYGNAAPQTAPSMPTANVKSADKNNAVADLGDSLLYAAFVREASDIHIDPGHQGARIRFRVDGQLEFYEKIKKDMYTELSSRLKVMAGLDIAEKRAPQDGRFTHYFPGSNRRVDIRLATLPTKYGERITMRLLAVQTAALTLDKLGLSAVHQQMIESFLHRLQGMMILTGPTGSGKTTTLYAAIRLLLQERNVNIITVEDPIEYEIDGVAQCEVDHTGEKVDFAKALRSILRHDPDVVMIGEIRDKETADIAIKAALTGHMVFGTLHTNSSAASITRLIDMGVKPYLVAAALRLTVAQRLLRRLCQFCRIARPLTEMEAIAIDRPELGGITIYDACGCVYCGNKGYAGRIGLYELLELREEWARAVAEGEKEGELLRKMRAAGVKSLVQDAIDKLIAGDTSYQEVLQIASSW